MLPLEQSLQISLIVLAPAVAAPFLEKVVLGAKGNIAFGVELMVLLMVVSIVYVPIALPLLLPGVEVHLWVIAQSLIVLMLIPLAIGLLMKSHSPESGDHWQRVMNKISSLAILIFADEVLTALVFAAKHGEKIDANQEFVGIGMANIGAGFLTRFPAAISA